MRYWNINTHENGNIVVNLVCASDAHVVNMVVGPNLTAAELGRVLDHMEDAALQHEQANPEKRPRGRWSGSLTVTAADGTDLTQPPGQPATDA